jgi:hypothetical protein
MKDETALEATQVWVVEYTSIGSLARTSFFWSETHAQQWFDFCAADATKSGKAAPTLYVSGVSFTEVTPT